MMKQVFSLAFVAMTGFGAMGCSTTMRVLTATDWIAPPGGAGAAAAAPAPAAAPAEGAAAAAPAAAPASAAPAAGASGLKSQMYVTYWEGSCGGFFGGCSRGDTKVKRCTVMTDNTVKCVDEANATKAFTPGS